MAVDCPWDEGAGWRKGESSKWCPPVTVRHDTDRATYDYSGKPMSNTRLFKIT